MAETARGKAARAKASPSFTISGAVRVLLLGILCQAFLSLLITDSWSWGKRVPHPRKVLGPYLPDGLHRILFGAPKDALFTKDSLRRHEGRDGGRILIAIM